MVLKVKLHKEEVKQKLITYTFPGNVRELKSVIELACVMSEGEEIKEEDLQINVTHVMSKHAKNGNYTLKEYTMKLIQQYLDEYDYDVLAVAAKLNVGKSTIYRMINSHQLKIPKKSDA